MTGVSAADYIRLVTESQKPLAGYIYSLVGNWPDTEDLLQETNVRLWEQQERYDPERPFMIWARTIARFMVMSYRSRQRRERMRFSDAAIELLAADSQEHAADLDLRHRALGHCLDALPRENRRLLDLCYFGGLAIQEVATRLDRSPAATYKAISRLRQHLFQCINQRIAVSSL